MGVKFQRYALFRQRRQRAMNRQKLLIGISLALLGLTACQSMPKVGEPVSNGTNTITVTEFERAPFNLPGFANHDILSVTVVSETDPFNAESAQKTNASLKDNRGNTFEANGTGIDERDSMKAVFTFIIPQASKHFEFRFLDYPVISLE